MKEKTPLPAEERRAVTIETVVDLAAEHDPAEITTAAIAERMNLTQGALFRHFPTKDALWQSVMDWVAEKLLGRIDTAIAGADSPLAALEAAFTAHVDFVARHSGVPRMLFSELQRSGDTPAKRMARTLIAKYSDRLLKLISAGKAAGEIDPRLDARAAVALFIGTVQGLVMQSLLSGDVSRLRRDAPAAFAIYLRGIRKSP